jgi:Peptidase family S41
MSVKLILPFLVLSSISITGLPQDSTSLTRKISANDVRQDLKMLKDTLDRIHPSMYVSQSAVDHIFDSCLASVRDSLTVSESYLLTSYLIVSLEDGHANCRLPQAFLKDYYGQVKVFPAELLFIHHKAYIFCCKQNQTLTKAEVLSINKVGMSEILRKMYTYMSSDGAILSRKDWELPDNFLFLYNELYGHKDSFAITYRTLDGREGVAILKAETIKNISCGNPFPRPNRYLSLNYQPGNIAVLTVRTFFDGFLQQTGENFAAFMDSAFKALGERKIDRLLIDLRNNQGGNDGNGELLYAHLTRHPFRYYESQETITEKFSEDSHPNLRVQQPSECSYSGKVYILINGRSFSATAEFAALARSAGRGVFIGEETGGGYYGDVSGDDQTVTLPHSLLACRIPEVRYKMAVMKAPYTDRGVIPDYVIYPEIADFVDGQDSQFDSALKVIEKSK